MVQPLKPGRSLLEVFAAFLKLGLTSFGGPIAHLGYYRAELVARREWLSEMAYADLVALCQFLPGPASSQVVIALGLHRAGLAECGRLGCDHVHQQPALDAREVRRVDRPLVLGLPEDQAAVLPAQRLVPHPAVIA